MLVPTNERNETTKVYEEIRDIIKSIINKLETILTKNT